MVTGGASGLGRAVALGAAERGAKVVVADIDRAGAEAVATSCGGHPLAVDLIKNPEQAVDDGARLLGGLDWWRYDSHLSPGRDRLADENRTLRKQIRSLERRVAALAAKPNSRGRRPE